MKQDEIIEIATKVWGECDWHESALRHLEAFAKLVAAKERDEILRMCNLASEATKEAKKELRADEIFAHSVASGAIHQAERLTNAIRARGEA